MKSKLQQAVLWGVTLLVLYSIDRALDTPKAWLFQVLPNSIFRLSADMWRGLALTFCSALFAWAIGSLGGYALGLCFGATLINGSAPHAHTGRYANKVYDALYVIPFVLTVSLFYAFSMNLHVRYGLPRILVGVIVVAVSGLMLGGYHVYKSVYESVLHAKRENRVLVNSLFLRDDDAVSWITGLRQRLLKVKRLRDCEISKFCESLPRALHLSIVAVMIVESIVPSFYETFIPQSGITKAWLGGAGRMILTAQQNYQFQVIAGCIWAVLFFDWIVSTIMEFGLRHRWLRYYRVTS